ncbi:hypothetical protein KAT55_05330, partial [Candidatus Bathyarchaeota archaeon]|nr:hypothetical protein [Candidatus Bathyarchaeota archaeon]
MMELDNEELVQRIKKIIEITESLPEQYQKITYEILLKNIITLSRIPEPIIIPQQDQQVELPIKTDFTVPIDVRALLSQYNLNEDVIDQLFLIEEDNIRPIYKITTTRKTQAQIQLAL